MKNKLIFWEKRNNLFQIKTKFKDNYKVTPEILDNYLLKSNKHKLIIFNNPTIKLILYIANLK